MLLPRKAWMPAFARHDDERPVPRCQKLRLSSQYLLALRDADCAEQPIGWLGIIPPDFDGSSPSEVMVEVFGRDAMERTQPFLKAAVIAVDVVDVEVGCLRPRPTGGR